MCSDAVEKIMICMSFGMFVAVKEVNCGVVEWVKLGNLRWRVKWGV